MREINSNCKRDVEESAFEASRTSASSLKKMKLEDDLADYEAKVISSSETSSADSAPAECSVSSGDDQSSSICSGCFSSETNEIAKNEATLVVDLEAHQITETETSTLATSDFRKERSPDCPVSETMGETTEMDSSSSATEIINRRKPQEVKKSPTPAEIEEFFSALENNNEQKRFIEKYNFDIVNEQPLEGRYQWNRFKL